MGNLVFQATLGGQVNLVGPNTASTFNLNVPAVAGTLVTTGDTGTVTNTMCATSVYTAPGTIGSGTPNTGAFTTLSATGVASFAAGSAAAPAITRTGDTDTGIFFPAANTLAFSTNGTEDARFDSAGNFGLGVTPSAWSGATALQINNALSLWSQTSGAARYAQNVFFDGSVRKYVYTGTATEYEQGGGAHAWKIASSGSAGGTISFTQAMTLDADGNLAVGATSVPGSNYRGYFLNSIASNAVTVGIRNTNSSGQSRLILGNDAGVARYTLGYTGTTSGGFGSSLAWIGTEAAEPLLFQTNGSERARFDPSGNLLVGTTSASGAKLRVYDGTIRCDSLSVNSTSAYFYQTSGAFTTGNAAKTAFYSESGVRSFGLGWLSDSGGSQAAWMTANSTNLGWVIQTDSANGVRLANTATSWSSYSDERLKNIIEEIPQALTKIAAIRAVRFSWKSDEENTPKVGVIAQDVQAVLPEVVDDDTDFMQVRYSELVPLCIKAIQEQQAIITQLQADVAALKG